MDVIRWTPSHNGLLSVKSAYRVVINNVYGNEQITFPWKKFWKTKLPPKIKHFLWKCMNDCLAVRNLLSRHAQGVEDICSFCNHEPETIDHLLLHCSVTVNLWNAVHDNLSGIINGRCIK